MYSTFVFGLLIACITATEGFPGYEKIKNDKPNSYKSTYKVCDGHSNPEGALQTSSNTSLAVLKANYAGCTHIKMHLSIANIHDKEGSHVDLSFLSNITEVGGMVYIFGNTVPVIPLPKLRLIRGIVPHSIRGKNYSLYITQNFAPKDSSAYIDLSSLASVMKHDIIVAANKHICNLNTVDWQAILENPKEQTVTYEEDLKCHVSEECSSSCPLIRGKRYCWGPSETMCQPVDPCNRNSCDATQARCFTRTDGASRCCHEQCVGGCTGISRKDCFSCRHFLNEQECQQICPPKEIYDNKIYQKVPNPKFRYTLGTLCVKECPEHYLREDESCVKKCTNRSFPQNGTCQPCYGNLCDRVCRISEITKEVLKGKSKEFEREILPEGDIHSPILCRSALQALKNCTNVDGHIRVTLMSTRLEYNESVRDEDFQNLKNVKQINGQVHLDLNSFTSIKSLDFLSNLESITSRSSRRGLEIYRSPSLEYLGLVNLKKLTVKKVMIGLNPKLCYAENIKKMFPTGITYTIMGNSMDCAGKVCDPMCEPSKGCWGPGPGMCFECQQRKAGVECVSKCTDKPGFYGGGSSSGACKRCHPECKASCSGPNANNCTGGCKNAKDGPYCVAKCPNVKYQDAAGECQKCAKECFSVADIHAGYDREKAVCTGPSAIPGPGGCTKCKVIEVTSSMEIRSCVESCPRFHFFESSVTGGHKRRIKGLENVTMENSKLCIPCDPLCRECYGVSSTSCESCRPEYYKRGENRCQKSCDDQTFPSKNVKGEKVCAPCSEECRTGCKESTVNDCLACRRFKIYLDDEKITFMCNKTCPADLAFTISESETGDTVCVDTPPSKSLIIGLSVGAFLIIFIIVGGIIFMCIQRRRASLLIDRDKLHAKYTRKLEEEGVALHTTDCTPNSGHLRIISAKRLNKVAEIGSGAFGTVYKGSWKPEKEDADELEISIDVAIKELKNTNDKTSAKEFLSEAHVMASVEHPFCMGLLGVCMSTHMQLVSEFMPLGSLSSYLPRHRNNLGSQRLLTWALQIAKGMAYLETRGIVHRDLAARNVLLQNEEQVRITDFGLAKLLDPGGDEIHAVAGKFPVKWLAMESLLSRTFSHKSDVWSYGVTLWEMFNFGARPYGDLRATEMYDFLESGERLKQPQVCTLDLYMLLIKCWLQDPESRPTFTELVQDVSGMAGDPGRFLIIENDTLRRAPLRDEKKTSDSTSPRVSHLLSEKEKDLKPGQASVHLPPESGVPHIESQLKNRNRRSPNSTGDHYSDNPVNRDYPSSSLPPPPPPPPAPKAGFEELDEGDIEEGDFEVEADYLMPDANQSAGDYVPPSPYPSQPLIPKANAAAVPEVEYVNQPPPRTGTVHNPNYESQIFGQQPSSADDDYLVPDDDDYIAPSEQTDQDDYLQPLMASGASRA